MAGSVERCEIEYGILKDSEADQMARLLGEVFSRRDPPAVAVGVTPAEFEDLVRLFCPRAIAQGLTVVARLASSGELIGAFLCEDAASEVPAGIDRISPKFDPIFDILGQLDQEYRAGLTIREGEALHLFLVGVAERFAGRGVAQRLVEGCLEQAARRGYRLAITEATNKISQHIFRKQGFAERVRRSYVEHRHGGRAVFASIAEHGGPALMDRSIEP